MKKQRGEGEGERGSECGRAAIRTIRLDGRVGHRNMKHSKLPRYAAVNVSLYVTARQPDKNNNK